MTDSVINAPTPKLDVAAVIFDLHGVILLICMCIFVVVFCTMFYALFQHRKRGGHQTQQFHKSTTVEVIWTLIPFLILIAMAWPAICVVLIQRIG